MIRWFLICLAAVTCAPVVTVAAVDRPIDFGRDIQPILSENCFHCHGPDAANRKADLRLDTHDGATETEAFVPGKSDDSEAIRRILSDDPAEQMPPPKSNLKLTSEQKQLLRRWVDEGAIYTRHWAFVAPVRPAVPPVPEAARIRNPIDAFIVERLTEAGLTQSPEADRAKLLRRVTLDLTGLPPTLTELQQFLNDGSPDAYEQAVNRLLESRRYGERMVWEWLDAARYADTNGYQGDPTRAMWYWRDWAIEAFNRNQPFDQFTIEQIAGDLLPNPTREQMIATGFHRNHMINGEGGRIPEESRVEYVQDRVETTGTVWMGLTLTCCRCHDHKYDPFSQKEYYQLAAYFNSIDESGANDAGGLANPVFSFAFPDQQLQLDQLKAEEVRRAQRRDEVVQQAAAGQEAWEAETARQLQQMAAGWKTLQPGELKAENGTALVRQTDGSVLANGANPSQDSFDVHFQGVGSQKISAIQLEALPDDRLPSRGPGRAENGNFVLSEFKLLVDGQPQPLVGLKADYEQGGFPVGHAVDGKADTGWAVAGASGRLLRSWFLLEKPVELTTDSQVVCRLECRTVHAAHVVGRFRISVTDGAPDSISPIPENVRTALMVAKAERTDAHRQELADYYLGQHAEVAMARQQADEARKAREGFERSLPRTMVMRERAQPRETFILVKGAYNAYADKVEHGVLQEILPLPADSPKTRLGLAQWLVSADHPLMSRVTVNRFWQQFFGTGLVKTSDDFGVQGDKPSHPALLDWLAVDFRESGWDVKRLVRMIVTSETYRQSARVTPELMELDPDNRLLGRGPRGRLPSWMIRDQALALSGLLKEQIGGPPVKGYQPPGIWEEATFGQIKYQQDSGDALYRRSLYTFWRRIASPTIFFDVANRQNCSVRLERTNTPLHALVTLNDVTYVEAARALAQLILTAPDLTDDTARLASLFKRATCRDASPRDIDRLQKRLTVLRQNYSSQPDAAAKLLKVGESPADASLEPAELAAWTALANLVLNLDEVICKE